MSRRLKTIATKVTWAVDANSGRQYSIGLTIHETYDYSEEQPKSA
jgi:hypothetical protein